MTTTRNILTRAWLAILIIIATACTRIEPGYEGVKVDMLGAGGIESEPLPTGRVWFNPIAYDVYEFPVFLQRVSWTALHGAELPRSDRRKAMRSMRTWVSASPSVPVSVLTCSRSTAGPAPKSSTDRSVTSCARLSSMPPHRWAGSRFSAPE